MGRQILVMAETREGGFRNVTFEALAVARRLAGDGKVSAVLIDNHADSALTEQLARYGADRVYVVKHPGLEHFSVDGYTQAFNQILRQLAPDGIIIPHTAVGKDLAPRIAARNGYGLVSDVVKVELAGDDVVFTRPIYAGKAFQKKKITAAPLVFTIRPNNFGPVEPDPNRTAEITEFPVSVSDIRTRIREIAQSATKGIDLTEAKIIVSGGRGVRSEQGFRVLYELAEVLGGAVGASRGACDAGYAPYPMQIGQTGKVVTPDLYIACGISGAIQHLAGMSNSRTIVAINTDPEAPIFKVADYGIVGDLFEVVPMLTEEFRKILG